MGSPPPDDLHRRAAARAKLENDVQQGDQAFAIGMQEAVIARAPETLGQDVLQDP
jgi:hypothetical protein